MEHDELYAAPTTGAPAARARDRQRAAVEHPLIWREGDHAPAVMAPSAVLGLQRQVGNAAVTALVQRRSGPEGDEQLDPSAVLDVVGKGGGKPLDPKLQDEMEARLGNDFSNVRVHRDGKAAESAAAVRARAYTVGNEIVLGTAAPDLQSSDGKRTLAHELTHVVQQRQGPVAGTPAGSGVSVSDPNDHFERAAEANAERAMAGDVAADGSAVQRQDEEESPEEETEETP